MIEQGISPTVQSTEGVSFAPKITKEEAKINWILPAKRIIDSVRAFTPNPGAWTSHKGLILNIAEAIQNSTDQKLQPGALAVVDKKLFVGTATESIEIRRIVPAGKKDMSASDWINGARLVEGEFFG